LITEDNWKLSEKRERKKEKRAEKKPLETHAGLLFVVVPISA
jgi:hypothetical protein